MILSERDRLDLTYVMKTTLLDQCSYNPDYFGKAASEITTFIREDATYEQLLNLTFNTKRNETYLPAEVLECAGMWIMLCEVEKMLPQDLIDESTSSFEKMMSLVEEKKSTTDSIKAQWTRLSKWIKAQKTDVSKKLKKYPSIKKYGKWATIGIAASVGAAFVFKKFLSTSSSQCKGKSGDAYRTCMKKVKISAQKEAIKALRTASGTCKQAPNPAKCKEQYKREITKRQAAISHLQ